MNFKRTVRRPIDSRIVMEDAELNQETRQGQRPARMVGYTSLDQKKLKVAWKPAQAIELGLLAGGEGTI